MDSSVILAVANAEATARAWVAALARWRAEGELVVGEAVWAETRAFFSSRAAHAHQMQNLGLNFLPMTESAASLAGEIYASYRAAGGKRERILSDFFIGAQALEQAAQLATSDQGFFRRHFRGLKIVEK